MTIKEIKEREGEVFAQLPEDMDILNTPEGRKGIKMARKNLINGYMNNLLTK